MSSFVLCVGCGTPLYGFSPCRWYTCERCGVDLRDGICPLCNLMNSCAYDPNPVYFDCPPDSYHPPHPTYETYSGDTCGNDSQFGYDYPPYEPIDSLSMGDEHLDTISKTESDEFIKSCVENLVPNPSESQDENGCDLTACYSTFSNILFDDEYEFDSVDDQSLHNEDFSEKIFSNLLFEEEIISIKKNQHHFDAESDLVESMLNPDSSVISSSSKIDSLLDEFRLLYDNSSPRPPEEFVYENSNAEIESFSPSPIPNEDSDSHMEEINLSFNPDDPMPPSIEDDDNDSEGDNIFLERLLHNDLIPLPDTFDFSNVVRVFLPFFTYPVFDGVVSIPAWIFISNWELPAKRSLCRCTRQQTYTMSDLRCFGLEHRKGHYSGN
nr:hypothetical protein [Tanacetum cinerariifolium]